MALGDDLAPLSPENHVIVTNSFTEVQNVLLGKTFPQTPDQTGHMHHVGAAGMIFINHSSNAAEIFPGMVPPYFKPERVKRVMATAEQFERYLLVATQIYQDLKDTVFAAKNVAYAECLIFYNSVQEAAKNNVTGAQAVLDMLSPAFERSASETEETQENTQPVIPQ